MKDKVRKHYINIPPMYYESFKAATEFMVRQYADTLSGAMFKVGDFIKIKSKFWACGYEWQVCIEADSGLLIELGYAARGFEDEFKAKKKALSNVGNDPAEIDAALITLTKQL